MNFLEKQLMKDAKSLNFDITKYQYNNIISNNKFKLPGNFDENTGRIIAMLTYLPNHSSADFHFYLRNGNGTCPNGHGDNCSMWSHKRGNTGVSNISPMDSTIKLCDNNINTYAHFNDYDYPNIYYYNISKDVDLLTSRHGNGHSGTSTGTPYYN